MCFLRGVATQAQFPNKALVMRSGSRDLAKACRAAERKEVTHVTPAPYFAIYCSVYHYTIVALENGLPEDVTCQAPHHQFSGVESIEVLASWEKRRTCPVEAWEAPGAMKLPTQPLHQQNNEIVILNIPSTGSSTRPRANAWQGPRTGCPDSSGGPDVLSLSGPKSRHIVIGCTLLG